MAGIPVMPIGGSRFVCDRCDANCRGGGGMSALASHWNHITCTWVPVDRTRLHVAWRRCRRRGDGEEC